MKIDEELTYTPTGERVRIVSIDSDPEVAVWTVLVSDPDASIMARRSELAR